MEYFGMEAIEETHKREKHYTTQGLFESEMFSLCGEYESQCDPIRPRIYCKKCKLHSVLGAHGQPMTHGEKLLLSTIFIRKESTQPTFESIAKFFLDAGLSVSFGRDVRQYNEVNGREIYLDGTPYVVIIMGEFMGISPMFLVMANSDCPIVGSEYKLVGDEYQFVFQCF